MSGEVPRHARADARAANAVMIAIEPREARAGLPAVREWMAEPRQRELA